jgi:MFS family permease
MKTLSPKAAFWAVAWILTISLWVSTAPTIVFPIYASEWHLSKAITTGIFATYPIVLILVLVLLGNISDYIGRRNTLLIGLIFLLISALAFASAPNVFWLFAGRILQGIGVGLTAGSGAAALVEFNPTSNKKYPGSINTITQAFGLFLATIIGAVLIKYAPSPLHFSYWVLTAIVIVSMILCLLIPQNKTPESIRKTGWKPQGIQIPPGQWGLYALAALAIGTGFANGAVFLSLGAQIARDVIGTNDILVIGTVLSIAYLLGAVSATIAGRMGPRTSIRAGMISVFLTVIMLVTASELHSFVLFVIAAILGGLGYGFSAAGGIGLAVINSPAQYRVQFISAVLVVAYLFQGLSAYGGGVISTAFGFSNAIWILSIVVAFLALLTLFLSMKNRMAMVSAPITPEPIG